MKKLRVRVLKPWGTYHEGQELDVACDKANVPLIRDWRRRLKDAEFDGCCEVVPSTRQGKRKQPNEEDKA